MEGNDVQQQQAQGGPSGDTGNYPNAETYSSKPKRYKRQQEREDFQHQLLATLSKHTPEEEQDSTELAMQAMLKKI